MPDDECASFQFYFHAFLNLFSDWINLKYKGSCQNRTNSSIQIDPVSTAVVWVTIFDMLFVHSSSEGQGQCLSALMCQLLRF